MATETRTIEMDTVGTFPFGQPVRVLVQQGRTPERVIVLGVYTSAVHARWATDQAAIGL